LSAGFETGPEGTLATDSQVAASTTPKPSDLKAYFPQLEIVEFIGQGGMGWVYLARQLNLDRRVALKVLPPDSGRDPFFAERFRREARALAQLNHPNIVGIHDIGQAGPYFHLVLEYVEGSNLRQLERTRRFTPSEALAIIPRICDALQYAHEAGIVHRDIKPENILIDRKGRVKITDFGIAKIVGKQPDITLTNPGDRVGTPHYMAPEQMGSPGDVDHRADIYALGVVFYEMLTGELPLGRFDSPSQKVPMDVRMDDIVLKSLEQDRERRYQSADAVKTDVETVASQPAIASGG
jgi:serine/threonine protein kinase